MRKARKRGKGVACSSLPARRHLVSRALCVSACLCHTVSQPSVPSSLFAAPLDHHHHQLPQDILPVCFRRPSFCPTIILEPSTLLLARYIPLYTSSHIHKNLLSICSSTFRAPLDWQQPCLNIMAMCQTPMTPITTAATETAPVVSPTLRLETPPPA